MPERKQNPSYPINKIKNKKIVLRKMNTSSRGQNMVFASSSILPNLSVIQSKKKLFK